MMYLWPIRGRGPGDKGSPEGCIGQLDVSLGYLHGSLGASCSTHCLADGEVSKCLDPILST